jgi:hypothetical protein
VAGAAARIVAPPGAEIEWVTLDLFFPFDLGIFVALALASAWTPWPRRGRAVLIGVPALVALEVLAVAAALAALLATQSGGGQAVASRFVDAVVRSVGLAGAAAAWYLLLGPPGAPRSARRSASAS